MMILERRRKPYSNYEDPYITQVFVGQHRGITGSVLSLTPCAVPDRYPPARKPRIMETEGGTITNSSPSATILHFSPKLILVISAPVLGSWVVSVFCAPTF